MAPANSPKETQQQVGVFVQYRGREREIDRQQRSALPRRSTCPFPSPKAVNWISSSSLLLTTLLLLQLISTSSSSYFFSFFFWFPNPSILLFVFPKLYTTFFFQLLFQILTTPTRLHQLFRLSITFFIKVLFFSLFTMSCLHVDIFSPLLLSSY